jgi:hypothetical protein
MALKLDYMHYSFTAPERGHGSLLEPKTCVERTAPFELEMNRIQGSVQYDSVDSVDVRPVAKGGGVNPPTKVSPVFEV